jgi:hypothetical protein
MSVQGDLRNSDRIPRIHGALRPLLVASLVISACASCGKIDTALDELEQLRRDANVTAAKAFQSSDEWRQEVQAWRNGKGRFADAAATFMENSIPQGTTRLKISS